MTEPAVSIFVAVLALIVSFVFSIISLKRGGKQTDKGEAAQLTTLMIKIDMIMDDVKDIKESNKENAKGIVQDQVQIANIEQRVKALEKNVFNKE